MRRYMGFELGRRGFTLVELLIALALVALLAAAVVLTSGGATDRAKALRIVSDLRSIKSAALLYYLDKGRWAERFEDLVDAGYIPSVSSPIQGSSFSIEGPKGNNVVIYGEVSEDGVRRALESMAEEAGLIGGEDEDMTDENYPRYRSNHRWVGMRIY